MRVHPPPHGGWSFHQVAWHNSIPGYYHCHLSSNISPTLDLVIWSSIAHLCWQGPTVHIPTLGLHYTVAWHSRPPILQPITCNPIAFWMLWLAFEIIPESPPIKPKLDEEFTMGVPRNSNSTQRGPGLLHCWAGTWPPTNSYSLSVKRSTLEMCGRWGVIDWLVWVSMEINVCWFWSVHLNRL